MLPISCTKDGITFTILSIKKNKTYLCKKDCWHADDCSVKKKCTLHPIKTRLVATEVEIALTNATHSPVKINTGPWELVDTEGYSCGGCPLCDELVPPRTVSPDTWSVSPGTRSRFILVFPELDNGLDVLSMIYSSNIFMRFDIKQVPSEIAALFEVKAEEAENETLPKEQISMDNEIVNLEFVIHEYMQTATEKQKDVLQFDFERATATYHKEIEVVKEQEQHRKMMEQKVDQLYHLTPREFEEWTESLFKALDFQNVVLTPQSGDKGLDLIAEKDGKKIAVQCKKFKGVVGTPIIQAFAGALQTADIDKGYFITTGTYSLDAEKMAQDLPIELYDRNSLVDLIELAMKTEN